MFRAVYLCFFFSLCIRRKLSRLCTNIYIYIYIYINLESRIPVDLLRRFIRFETDKNVSRMECHGWIV